MTAVKRAELALSPEQLKRTIQDPELFKFDTTADLDPYTGVIGQDRAVNALQFGVAMNRPGYNLYVMGDNGTGRSSYVKEFLKGEAKREQTPSDWLYVNNFDNPREPYVLELPAGDGQKFKEDFEELIESLLNMFPAEFENPAYQQRKSAIDREFNQSYDRALERVEQAALKHSVALFRDSSSISFAPMKDGKAMDEAEFAQLPDEVREGFHSAISELEEFLNDSLVELPKWRRLSTEKTKKLNQETIDQSLAPLLDGLREKYQAHEDVLGYLLTLNKSLHKTVVSELNVEREIESKDDSLKRTILEELYLPNVIVGREATAGAPVVYEPHPSYANLFGRIEYSNEQGALVTNFRKVTAGALHKANGGYLIIDADRMLTENFVYEALKRSLRSKQLKMDSPYSEMGLVNTTTLIPETMELDVKIILIGGRDIYYILQDADEDFNELFRVIVDFDDEIKRTAEQEFHFARLLKGRIEQQGYGHLTQQATIRLIEHSSRLAEDQNYLSAQIGHLFELLAESEFIRTSTQSEFIEAEHVERALIAKEERTGRVAEQIHQDILDGTVLIDTDGKALGKVNGLTVLSIGDTSFGAPARISATVYPGSRGIVDIEREADLGQSIHTKGVMILSGYLGNKYAQRFPLEISASLAMEQSYGHIDGDSASLGEACCLISAMTKIPLTQSYAITGSINQYGEVQAVGGVNEKIEGFFNLCEARGLTGEQGVIIPKSNAKNLMLKQDLVDAVAAGLFNIYAVSEVDEAIEILTGKKAGKMTRKGHFTQGSINAKVEARLEEIAHLGDEEDDEEDNKEENTDKSTDKNTKDGDEITEPSSKQESSGSNEES